MTVLLQISDPHFGTERPHVVTALQRLAHELRPDLLVLSGDITQRATRRQFGAARAFIDTLDVPHVLTIPGNHDIPLFDVATRIFQPYSRYSQAFGKMLEGEFENDELLLLTLNTTRWYRHVDGALSTAQIERVAQRFAQASPTRWCIVVTHQPLAVTRDQDANNVLHGQGQALQRWSAAGADVVMGGHIHLPYVLAMHQRIPALPGRLHVVQAGTALSSRVRAGVPNSVNVLRIQAPANAPQPLLVERWDYAESARRFECVGMHQLNSKAQD